ncbi:alpha/beta hydrolase [Candidatus Parcubacteria bacterium]|nr:alpha/beta hydrolase [Candidatus Parcubacteria bacterium]
MLIEEKSISIDNLFVNYKIVGKGQPIIFLHGWGHDSSHWEKVAQLVANQGYQVIVPDLPGFGRSQTLDYPWTLENYKEFVLHFSESLKLKNVFLLGHSFGGRIAILLTSEKNNLIVDKLILCAAAGLYKKQSLKFKVSTAIVKFFGNILEKIGLLELKQKMSDLYSSAINSDYQKANKIMRETLINIQKETLFHRIPKITAKTKIIWGKLDGITPLESADYLIKNIPNAQLKILEKGNHSPHIYMPEIVAQEINSFIKQ